MATAYTRADAITLHLSGVLGDAAAGTTAGALGGARVAVEVKQLDALITGFMPTVVVEDIGGNPGEGAGLIRATGVNALAYTPPGLAEGTPVTLANGDSVLLEGAAGSNYVRVRRDGTDDLGDAFDLDIRKVFGNLIGMGDISASDCQTGIDEYLAGHFHNPGNDPVSANIYIGTLGTARQTSAAQLGATGSGTIQTGVASGFADWPASGWARVRQSGGTLREIVYYQSRTDVALLVPADGRARLGTTASAGSGTDVVDAVPGIRIALEAPDVNGLIQAIADRNTAPTGVVWNTAITSGAGLVITDLSESSNYGLWIHREIPPGTVGAWHVENKIIVEVGGFTKKYSGLYRIASSDTYKVEVFIGEDARPNFAAADQTENARPFTIPLTPPVSGVKEFKICCVETDEYGLTATNRFTHDITIDDLGQQVNATITPPENVSLTEIGSGFLRLRATYRRGVDAVNADTFRYYVTTNATDPVAGVTARVSSTMRIGQGVSDSRALDVTLGPYDYAKDVRVLVTSYRTADITESENTTPVTQIVSTVAPPAPSQPSAGLTSVAGCDTGVGFYTTTYIDIAHTAFWRVRPGVTELWANTSVLVFRAVANGSNEVTLHSPFSFTAAAITGTGVAGAVEVASATVLYLCVGGQRRAKIDVTAQEITADSLISIGAVAPSDAPIIGPSLSTTAAAFFQVYAPNIGRWRTFLAVDNAGVFSTRWFEQNKS